MNRRNIRKLLIVVAVLAVPWVFTEKAWIIVLVDMKSYGNRDRDKLGPGEFSEPVSFGEFCQPLEKTLDFLKVQKRTNWKVVVKEHSEFLKCMKPAAQQ